MVRPIFLSPKHAVFVRENLFKVLVGVVVVLWLGMSGLEYLAERNAPGSNIHSFGDALWWDIVTFLTIGYGDHYPVTVAGRLVAACVMIAGVTSMGIVTAKISSVFLEEALKKGRRFVDSNKLKDHFIICGWKEDMHELLQHIIDFNPGLTSDRMVLVANVPQPTVDEIRAFPRLKKLYFLNGNYFEDAILRKAAPERAKKILILADRSKSASGQVASPTEVDARTIITAMTLSNIARGTLVAAEILDPKMDHYLKLASVSEIIYSREYSRLLIGNASGGTGVSNIIFDLLHPNHPTQIMTHAISESSIGKRYGQFKTEFEDANPRTVVIGILENTGNRHTIKDRALREAQKTTDMSRLVKNLRNVKEMRCNYPMFNPDAAYEIPEGSMVIVVQSRDGEARGRLESDEGGNDDLTLDQAV